jgi:hypothetical protein
MNNKTVIFNHIPKTAGLTLNSIIEKQYLDKRIFSTLDWKGGRREAIKYFKSLPESERMKYCLITGHSSLELFNYLRSPVVLVMFRNPVERVISLYSYVKRRPRHEFHTITNHYSLLECYEKNIQNEWKELSNGMSTSMAGLINKIRIDLIDENIDKLERTKYFLQKFCLVGLVEKFDESLVLFSEHLNWKNNLYYYKKNVSQGKIDQNEKLKEIILKYNKEDFDLYKFVENHFLNLVNNQNSKYQQRVKSFKLINEFSKPILLVKNKFYNYMSRYYKTY